MVQTQVYVKTHGAGIQGCLIKNSEILGIKHNFCYLYILLIIFCYTFIKHLTYNHMYKKFLLFIVAGTLAQEGQAGWGDSWGKLTNFWHTNQQDADKTSESTTDPEENEDNFQDLSAMSISDIMDKLSKMDNTPGDYKEAQVEETMRALESVGVSCISHLDSSLQERIVSELAKIKDQNLFSEVVKRLQELCNSSSFTSQIKDTVSYYMNVLSAMHEVKNGDPTTQLHRLSENLKNLGQWKGIFQKIIHNGSQGVIQNRLKKILERFKKVKSFNEALTLIDVIEKEQVDQYYKEKSNNKLTEFVESWFEEKTEDELKNIADYLRHFVYMQSHPEDKIAKRKEISTEQEVKPALELERTLLSACSKKDFKSCATKISNDVCFDRRLKPYIEGSVCAKAVQSFVDTMYDTLPDHFGHKLSGIQDQLAKIARKKNEDAIQDLQQKKEWDRAVAKTHQSNFKYREIARDSTLPEGVGKALQRAASNHQKPVIQRGSFA